MASPDRPESAAEASERELDTHWRPVQYFSFYRLLVAAFFLAAINLGGGTLNIGEQNPRLFEWVSFAYLVAALFFWVTVSRWRRLGCA